LAQQHVGTESGLFGFVQRTQIAAAAWLPPTDLLIQLRSVFDLLESVPPCISDDEQHVLVEVVRRLSIQVFFPTDTRHRQVQRSRISSAHRRHVLSAFHSMLAHFHEPGYSIRSAAEGIGLSHWHLSRLISCESGSGFHSYLRIVRVLRCIKPVVAVRPLS
jgi:hypothetical protein